MKQTISELRARVADYDSPRMQSASMAARPWDRSSGELLWRIIATLAIVAAIWALL